MKVETFWNNAFLAALSRVPPAQAKVEADEATRLVITHWQEQLYNWGPSITPRWQDQNISEIPRNLETPNAAALEGAAQ
ncbi:hypothetical protein [Pseudoxanthomonas sp. 3HH-4]|uniref:hypothetical protein n=1 Tax=Pseudoxanthomonas sp. 3HH-4 TaxID=1690214 RepID=UPI00114F0442|nr:hypothetical protein [Pseudoxanthomonas sp. 3HH-4]